MYGYMESLYDTYFQWLSVLLWAYILVKIIRILARSDFQMEIHIMVLSDSTLVGRRRKY